MTALFAVLHQGPEHNTTEDGQPTTQLPAAPSQSPFRVFTSIPGRQASTHYTAKVRASGTSTWSDAMVLQSTARHSCPKDDRNCESCGYFSATNGFSQSWLTLEIDESTPVEILVQRSSSPISEARVVPASSATVISIGSEGVIIRLSGDQRFHVDVDGGFDQTDTGPEYTGGPMHTMAIFANPMLDAPDVSQSNVLEIRPEDWHNNGNPLAKAPPKGTTVVFAAGVHRPSGHWVRIQAYANTKYFLQPDAIIMAGLGQKDWLFGEDKTLFTLQGYGVFSGEEMSRQNPANGNSCDPNDSIGALLVATPNQLDVSGVTMVDFPNHHLKLQGGKEVEKMSILSNIKIIGWRANGDGIHVFGNWRVSKAFVRTQDDSCYLCSSYNSQTVQYFDDITTWNDANGAAFIVCGVYGSRLTNSHAIYHRAQTYWWDGGRIFTHRAKPGGKTSFFGDVRNLAVENFEGQDPFPSMNAFQLQELNQEGETTATFGGNVSFTNVKFAATSTARKCGNGNGCNCHPKCALNGPMPHGVPNVLQGWAPAKVSGVEFQNVQIAGHNIGSMLDGSLPGYFNVTPSTVSDITVDGKVVDLVGDSGLR